MKSLTSKTISLLQKMIAIQSYSKEEEIVVSLINDFLKSYSVDTHLFKNNVWAANKYFNKKLPTILLNSHHDTVKPNTGYTRDPLSPDIENGTLYGLGSNDAGGPLVSLIATFLHYHEKENLKYNLVIAATAEEEISGKNGVACILDQIPKIDLAIVGEPTEMHLAIAEKGLMVLDCTAQGESGHAAREEGKNAIYIALEDINWVKSYQFSKVSDQLGPVKMSATVINAGSQHNVVPDTCNFTLDVRTTDAYSNEEVMAIIQENLQSKVVARSFRLNPSSIAKDHPLIKSGVKLGRKTYGSPTTSDQALLPVPSLKMGPGDSARSHTADEYIHIKEIEEGIALYIKLLEGVII
jgi:acetylornithine deacetylase